ncbi:hypothetical protein [Enterococcus faecium]|uniref:Uncharacterized protein n=1 Tax=Enterococcus faecium TaxID=1352 RepID=A0A242BJZ7_ENTFC|nr:hypothetical protein [Enterococcus faecium]OTN93144.1 hypothetical protein A5810_002603 [Enterococcus faecium]OTN94118.1 hypothetical protein A5810_002018 [Enterococcus faecium]OTN95699.1 hypothetical protein A5810_000004 [Enterococcus faecium]
MEIPFDRFSCVTSFEGKDILVLVNLDKEEALALFMKHVVRFSHELDIPISVILREVLILRKELLLFDRTS